MEMKMSGRVVAILCVAVVFSLMSGAEVSEAAVTCNPILLSPCATTITSGTEPSPLCCSKIKQQRPCLCNYIKDPRLQKFINSPNARKIAVACATPFPKC